MGIPSKVPLTGRSGLPGISRLPHPSTFTAVQFTCGERSGAGVSKEMIRLSWLDWVICGSASGATDCGRFADWTGCPAALNNSARMQITLIQANQRRLNAVLRRYRNITSGKRLCQASPRVRMRGVSKRVVLPPCCRAMTRPRMRAAGMLPSG